MAGTLNTFYLSSSWQTQNEFLLDVAKELYKCIPLFPQDFIRIAELNAQYADLPGDFADLSKVKLNYSDGLPKPMGTMY